MIKKEEVISFALQHVLLLVSLHKKTDIIFSEYKLNGNRKNFTPPLAGI